MYQALKSPGHRDSSENRIVGKAEFAVALDPLGRLKAVDSDFLNVMFPLRRC